MEIENSVPREVCVSVVVPVYNQERFIKKCLDSIIAQKTNFNFEIIIGEDDSSDETRPICLEYAHRYPEKIRLFLRKKEDKIILHDTISPRFNFIENIRASKGEFIAFCDGDDYWKDDCKLQKQYNFFIKNPKVTYVYHDAKVLRNEAFSKFTYLQERKTFNFKKNISAAEVVEKSYILHSTVMVKKSVINLKPYPYLLYSDFVVCLQAMQYGEVKYLDLVGSVYRVHADNLSNKIPENYVSIRVRSVLEILPFIKEELSKELIKICQSIIKDHWLINKADFELGNVFFSNNQIKNILRIRKSKKYNKLVSKIKRIVNGFL